MLTTGPHLASIGTHLLSQVDAEITGTTLAGQKAAAAIEQQAMGVAELFSGFAGAATRTLDVCIYDFRLDVAAVSDTVVKAINDAAERGVAVRIAYDRTREDDAILKRFAGAGGDPAPTGTHRFLTSASLHPAVQLKPVLEEGIAVNSQIMHHKYMVADRARVWMGSANFTVDAWALQENNVVIVSSEDLGGAYATDFGQLWSSGQLKGTGAGVTGTLAVDRTQVTYAFAPAEGRTVERLIASTIAGASRRLRVASMVTSSPAILQALKRAIDAGRDTAGVYDYAESHGVVAGYRRRAQDPTTKDPAADTAKADLIEAVLEHLVPKRSLPISSAHPDWAHNLMHDKIVVADDIVVTGSFNFSTNATRNAENVLRLESAALADAYAAYIDGLVSRYRANP